MTSGRRQLESVRPAGGTREHLPHGVRNQGARRFQLTRNHDPRRPFRFGQDAHEARLQRPMEVQWSGGRDDVNNDPACGRMGPADDVLAVVLNW
jgi:hypothetical protein